MTVSFLITLLSVLFIAVTYLHYKQIQLTKRLHAVTGSNMTNFYMIANLTRVLSVKGIVTQEDYEKLKEEYKAAYPEIQF